MSTADGPAPSSSPTRRRAAASARAWLRENMLVLLAALICAALIFGALYSALDAALRHWADRDLERRSQLIWRAVGPDVRKGSSDRLLRQFESLSADERIVGILACWSDGTALANNALSGQVGCHSPLARLAFTSEGNPVRGRIAADEVRLTAHRIGDQGWLVVVQDRTFLATRRERLLRIVSATAAVAILGLLMLARAGARIGRSRAGRDAQELFRSIGASNDVPSVVPAGLEPLAADVSDTLTRLKRQRHAVVESSGAARLRRVVDTELAGSPLIVIANREPYIHETSSDGTVRVERPPSGLVTAIEPILRMCGGTWIAHGSGSADRQHADRTGRLGVPPDHPEYVLRRLWIDEQEYDGYYFGFANEGLWPLCHIAHTRPAFRRSDWEAYQAVNEQFAHAAGQEIARDGLLLTQDYHFALVPRMVREIAPAAVTSLFWHIPWPNSEVIGICPWKEALLDGMLGADVIGFHTRYHCLNFLETLQRYVECRVNFDDMSVEYLGRRTLVRAYPISVEWPHPSASRQAGQALRASYGIAADAHVSIGVDRADYTKGLIERMAAVELLLERNADLHGKFVLVQLASPSRTKIRKYRELLLDLEDEVQKINQRFATDSWTPIVLVPRTFSPEEVRLHYAMANSALVTPLHDGMNLVAKEYVASCFDDDGVLVLSTFAGASKELQGALIVNPYDSDEVAGAILRAIRMPEGERRARMTVMRQQIAAHSIYDWSANLLHDMAKVRERRTRFWPQGDNGGNGSEEVAV